MASLPPVEERWVQETLRLNQRYLLEIVEHWNLCPWARRAREDGHVARHVFLQQDEDLEAALHVLKTLGQNAKIDVGLLIFPRLTLDRPAFERFSNRLINEDARRYGFRSPPFALAAFHPEAARDDASAERLVPYVRRSPDPTIQAVRVTALERVRGRESAGTAFVDPRALSYEELTLATKPHDSLRQRVARANLETLQAHADAVERALDDIRQDRERTQQALLAAENDEGARATE